MRTDPLAFLTTELDALKTQGLYRTARVLDGEQKAHNEVDHRRVITTSPRF